MNQNEKITKKLEELTPKLEKSIQEDNIQIEQAEKGTLKFTYKGLPIEFDDSIIQGLKFYLNVVTTLKENNGGE